MDAVHERVGSVSTAREIAGEAIDAWRRHQSLGTTMSAMRATAKVEQLLRYLVSTFPADVTRAEVEQIDSEEGDGLTETYLDSLRPAAVPLAIMREVLARREVKFDLRGAPSWRVFLRRYGDAMAPFGIAWRGKAKRLAQARNPAVCGPDR